MTQEELWTKHWQEVMDFMEANHRKPSKHRQEEIHMHNWRKQQKKLLNAGKLAANRIDRFKELLAVGEQNRHFNQYR